MMNLAPDAAEPAFAGLLVREAPPDYGDTEYGDAEYGDAGAGPGKVAFTPGNIRMPSGLLPPTPRPPRDLERDDIDVLYGLPGGEARPDGPPLPSPESLMLPPPWVLRDPRARAMREKVLAVRRAQLPLVRALAEVWESGQFYDQCDSSMSDYAWGFGLSTREAYTGLHAGHLFKALPGTESLFLDGRLSLDNAGLLGELHEEEGGLPSDKDWVRMACELSYRELSGKIEARREERRQGAPVRKVEVKVTRKTRLAFARARTLASRKARRPLTRGEAFAHIVQDYLDRHDPMRRIGRKGRRPKRVARCSLVGDYLPRAEKDRCRLRFGDRCAVAGCTNRVFLDFAHIRARALGGANRWWNLLFLCRNHHRMFDGKRMFLVGPAGGEPWFEDRKGRKVADLRAPPPEYFALYPKRE